MGKNIVFSVLLYIQFALDSSSLDSSFSISTD